MSEQAIRWSNARVGSARLLAFRVVCAGSTLVTVYVAAALARAPHASWVTAGIGVPAAIIAALLPRTAPPTFLSCSPVLHDCAAARPRVLLPVAGLLALLLLLPVLLTKLPAFDDYANHLARIFVIMQHGSNPLLDRFYDVRWHVVPNLVLDLAAPLAAVTGLYAAGKLLVISYTLLLLAGPHALHLALYRRWSFGPLLAVPLVYGTISKWGALNYELALGVALFATAAWIAAREAPALLRGLLSLACVALLFICHLLTVALYGLAIASFELWRTCAMPAAARPRAGDALALILPFAALVPLMLLSPGADMPTVPWQWGDVHTRLDALRYVVEGYFPTLDLVALLAIIAGLIWAIAAHAVRLPAFAWYFLAFCGFLFLLSPATGIGPWEVVGRLPDGVAFFVIGMLAWDLDSPRRRGAFLAVVVALSLFRMSGVAVAFRSYDRIRADFERSLPRIAPGSRILVADDYAHQQEDMAPLKELACLAMIERSSMVSMAYANPYKQILAVRPRYLASAGPYNDDPIPLPLLLHPEAHEPAYPLVAFDPTQRIYWAHWIQDYDYVYVMNRAGQSSPDPRHLELLFDGDRFQLFGVRHS